MQRWEYKSLRTYQGDVISIDGLDTGQGGKKRPKFPEYLNVLGREGWDVIYFGPDVPGPTGTGAIEILLKRPLQ
jgi:hypothetical protein